MNVDSPGPLRVTLRFEHFLAECDTLGEAMGLLCRIDNPLVGGIGCGWRWSMTAETEEIRCPNPKCRSLEVRTNRQEGVTYCRRCGASWPMEPVVLP
jgi:hypothetical protein